MEAMHILWRRIEQGFATHSPHLMDLLLPGTSEEELLQAEEALGVPLPEDFKTFYRLHNGGCLLAPLGYGEHLTLSLDQIVGNQRAVGALGGPGTKHYDGNDGTWLVQPFLWHPQRIPFLWGGYGSEFFCLDMVPGPGGQVGQIVFAPHATQTPDLIASSFQAFVAKATDDMEAEDYAFDPKSFPSALP